jgi:hypothetical protein
LTLLESLGKKGMARLVWGELGEAKRGKGKCSKKNVGTKKENGEIEAPKLFLKKIINIFGK